VLPSNEKTAQLAFVAVVQGLQQTATRVVQTSTWSFLRIPEKKMSDKRPACATELSVEQYKEHAGERGDQFVRSSTSFMQS
jgi:hypothetical protein